MSLIDRLLQLLGIASESDQPNPEQQIAPVLIPGG